MQVIVSLLPSDFEYQCNDSIDNDGDCCNDRDDDGGLNLPYYQPESLVECTSGFEILLMRYVEEVHLILIVWILTV